MAKKFVELIKNWFTPILFIVGMALVAYSAFLFNLILGYLVLGIILITIAYLTEKEMG